MKYIDQIAKRLNVRITDMNVAACLDSYIVDVDLSSPDEIIIHTHRKKAAVKIKDGKFDIYGLEKDEKVLRTFSGLFISVLGWDDTAFPIEQSKLISYRGRMPENKATNENKNEAVFTITAPAAEFARTSATNPKDAFSNSASTQKNNLQDRAELWRSRGLQKVDIRDDSVWVSVKENVVIEDRGKELKLHGDYDLQAISLMVSHAKETWNNNCSVHGDNKFRMLVWRECYIQGVKLQNFEPSPREKQHIISGIEKNKRPAHQTQHSPAPVAA